MFRHSVQISVASLFQNGERLSFCDHGDQHGDRYLDGRSRSSSNRFQNSASLILRISAVRLVATLLGLVLTLGILDHSFDLSSARASEATEANLGMKLLPRIIPTSKQSPLQLLSTITIVLKVFCPPLSTFDLTRNIGESCHLTVGYGCTDLSPPVFA